jgi:putative acetyltransferase
MATSTPEQDPSVEIRREEIETPSAQALIRDLNGELRERYPEPGANHFRLDAEEVAEGRGALLVAYRGEVPVACGALRLHDKTTAEIKRMYVIPEERGKGISRRILAALEAEGRKLGARRLVLETGERQTEALALYERAGFARIPRFGEYASSPLSICMAKDLPAQTSAQPS